MTGRTAIVAGNGPSIARIDAGRVLVGDAILRTNNFFFEPMQYLGRRVDLAVMAGDPRVAPFVFQTLWTCRDDYDLQAWTSHNPAVVRAGRRRFPALYRPPRFRDPELAGQVGALIARHGCKPLTGTYAVLLAHGLGFDRIILAGIDMYAGTRRYAYQPGPRCRALLGQDLEYRGLDGHLHDPALDRRILEMLIARGDVELSRASDDSAFDDLLPLAPIRAGQAVCPAPRRAPPDWAGRSGLYHIDMLRLMRLVRGWQRKAGRGRPA